MCEKAVEKDPKWIPQVCTRCHLKTREMCEKAVEKDPWNLEDVPDHLKEPRDV